MPVMYNAKLQGNWSQLQ